MKASPATRLADLHAVCFGYSTAPAILSRKGGTGKTTLAINLAVAAWSVTGTKVVLIDLDSQASATNWGDSPKNSIPW